MRLYNNTGEGVKSIPKRKTTTSNEVKTRWMSENYKRYGISLRYDTDGDLISYIEANRDNESKGTTDIFRIALREYIKKNEDG